ncbi:MAG: L-threonylcarbamoyladenylate synthase [Burkholderiales bacterium]
MLLAGQDAQAIAQCAQALRNGELVGIPTETVYGLAADAENDAAVAQIFAAKGRPIDHPLIVHVADAAAAQHFAAAVPAFAAQLMQAFWPGPLTLILPRRPERAALAAGRQHSVGLRCPAHPVAQALLQACAVQTPPVLGLAAPSANRFGRLSPTTAAHVQAELGTQLRVLDGGACAVGIESSIVDCTAGVPVGLRPGAVSWAQIEAACGLRVHMPEELASHVAPRSSGSLASHYAPQAKLRLMDARALQTALDLLGADAAHIAIYARAVLRSHSHKLIRRRMPDDAAATAQQLFAVLREFDDQRVKLIWIETPPDAPDWLAVHDRLLRAAA